jgi:hypothetical protein
MKTNNYRRILFAAAGVVVAGGAVAQDGGASAPLFQVGAVEVRPNVAYGLTYDDNIFATHRSGNKQEDIIHRFSPGVTLGAGDYRSQGASYFSANYVAGMLFYQDNDGANANNHNASISLGGGERLNWRFDQTLVSASDADTANLAAAGQVKRRAWSSTLGAVYDLSDKTNLESSFAYILNDYDTATTFDSWRAQGNALLDYEMTAKLHYAIGGSVGYDQVDASANSIYEQVNTRAVWEISPKLAMRTSVGVEFRQYQGIDLDRAYFVYDVAADWKISPLTVASLGTSRGVTPSNSLANQVATRTSVNALVSHKVGERYTATLSTGYSMSDLATTGTSLVATQEDDYWFARPALAARLADRLAAAAFYQFRRNDSTAAANASDFTNHQIGASLSYAF